LLKINIKCLNGSQNDNFFTASIKTAEIFLIKVSFTKLNCKKAFFTSDNMRFKACWYFLNYHKQKVDEYPAMFYTEKF